MVPVNFILWDSRPCSISFSVTVFCCRGYTYKSIHNISSSDRRVGMYLSWWQFAWTQVGKGHTGRSTLCLWQRKGKKNSYLLLDIHYCFHVVFKRHLWFGGWSSNDIPCLILGLLFLRMCEGDGDTEFSPTLSVLLDQFVYFSFCHDIYQWKLWACVVNLWSIHSFHLPNLAFESNQTGNKITYLVSLIFW